MAYQTNSGELFYYLNQLLVLNKINDTIHILSDASSSDATLNGDLKFLKLRVNKKLMVPAGAVGGPPKEQIQDVVKLVQELKNAHARRNVFVYTITEPSKNILKNIPQNQSSKSKKKTAVWPWVLLFLLLGGGAAGYFLKDQIMEIEFVKNIFSDDAPTENKVVKNDSPKSSTTKKDRKTSTPKQSTPKEDPPKQNTSTSSASSRQLSKGLGTWYIQIASYAKLDQALKKRERVALSFDRSIVIQKNINGRPNYRVIIPGFKSKENAEAFKAVRKVNNLHTGAFTQTFNLDCKDMDQEDTYIYFCN